CGCPADFICENNICIGAEKDECSGNADCDDDDVSTSDTCSGTPKKCEHAPITDCVSGDDYCPPGCTYVNDGDCEQIIEAEEQAEEEIDVSGLNITGDQESPDIYDITITPVNVTIGEEMLVEARVIDANGKDDIARVWFEILELAQSHGEIEDMNDAGADGDGAAGDDVYTALRIIDQYYLEGYYHLTVFAQDHAGNKKKSQTMFRVTVPEE
ncbi:TPA: hypothetical protein HA265_01670, partial [Candidatus Woesearchaeota archaeon]|nr:hypothetical protein [Candidatus Woesearchaeota archaeon]